MGWNSYGSYGILLYILPSFLTSNTILLLHLLLLLLLSQKLNIFLHHHLKDMMIFHKDYLLFLVKFQLLFLILQLMYDVFVLIIDGNISCELGWVNEDKISHHGFPPSIDTRVFVCGLPGVYLKLCGPRTTPEVLPNTSLYNLGYSDEMVVKF